MAAKMAKREFDRPVRWDHSILPQLFLDQVPQEFLPVAKTVADLFQKGQFSDGQRHLKENWISPQLWGDSDSYYRYAQFSAFVSKIPAPGDEAERKKRALSNFLVVEGRCRRTNRRHQHFDRYPSREPEAMSFLMKRARHHIGRVIGELDERKLEQVYDRSRFGPGMTLSSQDAIRVTTAFKLCDDVSIGDRAVPYFEEAIKRDHHWLLACSEVDLTARTYQVRYRRENSCRLTFVPKDGLSVRPIAIEPAGNVTLQLGVHEVFRGLLLTRAGIDLGCQKHNQDAARSGAANWEERDPLVTLDLSSASDSLTLQVVRRLLPRLWCGFLNDIRSPTVTLPTGDTLPLEKFSSMGNGFTFALETLIFWGLAKAAMDFAETSDQPVYVYGDDIVLPRSAAGILIEGLQWCGFRLNTEKSFLFGPFRESCGSDYYGSDPVRPKYVRRFRMKPADVFHLVNELNTLPFPFGRFSRYALKQLGKLALYAPTGSCPSDAAIHRPRGWCEKNVGVYVERYQSYRYIVVRCRAIDYSSRCDEWVRMAVRLRSSSREDVTRITLRSTVKYFLGSCMA